MDEVGRISLESNINQLAEAVQELSNHIRELQQGDHEESERFEKFKESGALLEFTLVTGGFIRGEILWIGNDSMGIRTDSGQNVILYKHAIAFVQEQAE